MDTSTLLPAGGAGLLILGLAGYLLRQIPADRQDYRQALADEQARTKAAEARTVVAERRADRFQQDMDAERDKRRDAETALGAAQAHAAAQRRLIEWLTADRRRLESYLPPAVGSVLPDPPDPPQEEL